jgi:hypothetical protein
MIKMLLDANFSYRLVKKLNSAEFQVLHVESTNLPRPAKDMGKSGSLPKSIVISL